MWAFGQNKSDIKKIIRSPQHKRVPSLGIKKINVPVPKIKPDEILIKIKSSALNYNNIWSSLCYPLTPDQLVSSYIKRNPNAKDHDQDFFIFGSDASGIIEKVGKNINQWVEGDEVIIHCNVVNEFDNLIQQDGMLSKSQSIWGYETNYGAFAEYTKVRASQLIRKPKNLDWNTAASFCLTLSTAYRMLVSDNGSPIKAGETCLIWGAAGGLGSFAIQLAKLSGANVIAIVSSDRKIDICKKLGADLVINRKKSFPNNLINENGEPDYASWKNIKNKLIKEGFPSINLVFEHVGRETLGLSTYLIDRGGRVVICAASSGFIATLDLRFLWMQLKTIIGSHFANYNEAVLASELIFSGKIKPLIHSVNDIEKIPYMMDQMFLGNTYGKILFEH